MPKKSISIWNRETRYWALWVTPTIPETYTAKVAITAGHILKKLGYDDHTIELARIVELHA